MPGYEHLVRLVQAAKHHLADPRWPRRCSAPTDKLITGGLARRFPRDGTLLGALFESLVSLSVRVYAQLHQAQVSHRRQRDGRREVDLIVERSDGGVVAFEVKLGAVINDDDVKHLLWLRERLGERLLDAAVVSTEPPPTGVPAALLGV